MKRHETPKESPEYRKQRIAAENPQRPKRWGKQDLSPKAERRKAKKNLRKDI